MSNAEKNLSFLTPCMTRSSNKPDHGRMEQVVNDEDVDFSEELQHHFSLSKQLIESTLDLLSPLLSLWVNMQKNINRK